MTRDIEIKNRLTVTRGGGGITGGKKGKGFQGPCIKDPWTKQRGQGLGVGGGVGQGEVVAGEWRQLYLNNNKEKEFKKNP